jgi:hypothetical protein
MGFYLYGIEFLNVNREQRHMLEECFAFFSKNHDFALTQARGSQRAETFSDVSERGWYGKRKPWTERDGTQEQIVMLLRQIRGCESTIPDPKSASG